MKFRYIAMAISVIVLTVFSIATVIQGGFNFGIDFAGGVKIIATFDKGVSEGHIRESIKQWGPEVQQIGEQEKNEYIITTGLPAKESDAKIQLEEIKKSLEIKFPNIKILSQENVGPTIGAYLKKSAVKLFGLSVLLMLIYLAFRFEVKYAIGVFVALVHDVAICILFSGATGVEINIPVLAAVLTIFGFSANDTIVIFDRIRENMQVKSKQTFVDIINKSITQTLSRTFITTLTVLFSVIILNLLGGEVLHEFSLVMLIGLLSGTYSTVFIASPVMVAWEKVTSS